MDPDLSPELPKAPAGVADPTAVEVLRRLDAIDWIAIGHFHPVVA